MEENAIFWKTIKIKFDEETNTLSILLPGNNTVEVGSQGISISDQYQNKVEMGPNGICINSIKEIRMNAKTDITINSGDDIKIKAKSKAVIEGLDIEAKAQARFTAKGATTAELSSSAQTIVKGAMVMIN